MAKVNTDAAGTKAKKDTIMSKVEDRFLDYKLTEKEIAEASQSLAKHLGQMNALDDQLKAIKAEFKAKVEKCQADINVQVGLVRDKKETRLIPCDVEFNYTACTIKVTRKDTKEIISDRKMTGNEKQMDMNF